MRRGARAMQCLLRGLLLVEAVGRLVHACVNVNNLPAKQDFDSSERLRPKAKGVHETDRKW